MTQTHAHDSQPQIRLVEEPRGSGSREFCFHTKFRIGRDPQCELCIESDVVSRAHAEVEFQNGAWWVRDLDSRNGVYVDGRKVSHAQLFDGAQLRMAHDGPKIRVAIESPEPVTVSAAPLPQRPNLSVSKAILHYFQATPGRRVGRHTQLIQQAYTAVMRKERRRYAWILAGAGVVLLVALGYGIQQRIKYKRLETAATGLFYEMKILVVQTFDLRRVIEQEAGTDLSGMLARVEDQQQRLRATYEGYVEELGVYRKLKSEDERLIYRTARVFNESEFAMKASFVEEVKEMIRYWQTEGRDNYLTSIDRAERSGYTPYIVNTLRRHGLPPEFFYLALQESAFVTDQVGPMTRWGRAKGMWQFIPATAAEYGLDPGVRANSEARDPTDDRQDFQLSTQAAARYLRDIHGELTQASGLLVMAAYNWGEHRVTARLDSLATPRAAFENAFDDVPKDPNARNYWRFLEAYRNRIPRQTRQYVLRIFAAAVIGQDPEHFGFDFENPLQRYVD